MTSNREDTRETSVGQQISFLKKISFFQDFDDNELRQFLSVSKWLKIHANTVIIKEKAMERVFYILVRGSVLVYKTITATGEIVKLTTLKTGDCFGEMSLFSESRRTAGVITLDDSFILMVDPEIINTSNVFLQLKFYKRFCEILVSRLIHANRMVVHDRPKKQIAGARQRKNCHCRNEKTDTYDDEDARSANQDDRNSTVPAPENRQSTQKEHRSSPSFPIVVERVPKSRLHHICSSPETVYPVNSAAAEKIHSFLASGETGNTRKLADLIGLDPFLAARVLQVANSSYFRRSNVITTIPHAMITLGMDQVLVVLRDTLESSLHARPFGGDHSLYKKFWRHCVIVGRVGELLREIIRANIPGDVFLAGLFHDFGKFLVDAASPRFYMQIELNGSMSGRDLVKTEAEHIGIDHGKAGHMLAEKMGLPPSYLEVMQCHHAPEKARDHALMVALVHLADLFTHARETSVQDRDVLGQELPRSFGWIILQEQHRAFLDVNVMDFVSQFSQELMRTWANITMDLPG